MNTPKTDNGTLLSPPTCSLTDLPDCQSCSDLDYLLSSIEKMHEYVWKGGPEGPEQIHSADCWVCKLLKGLPSRSGGEKENAKSGLPDCANTGKRAMTILDFFQRISSKKTNHERTRWVTEFFTVNNM